MLILALAVDGALCCRSVLFLAVCLAPSDAGEGTDGVVSLEYRLSDRASCHARRTVAVSWRVHRAVLYKSFVWRLLVCGALRGDTITDVEVVQKRFSDP